MGYGENGEYHDESQGIKRMSDAVYVEEVDTNYFEIGGSGICFGDSGGPFFTQNSIGQWVISGIHSYSNTSECAVEYGSFEVNVYSNRDWIIEEMDLMSDTETQTSNCSTVNRFFKENLVVSFIETLFFLPGLRATY